MAFTGQMLFFYASEAVKGSILKGSRNRKHKLGNS